jgi:hypothetical protein
MLPTFPARATQETAGRVNVSTQPDEQTVGGDIFGEKFSLQLKRRRHFLLNIQIQQTINTNFH